MGDHELTTGAGTGVHRRRVLTGIAVGAGAAWSLPAVTSVGRAFAGEGSPAACGTVDRCETDLPAACGDFCAFVRAFDGSCFCADTAFCEDLETCATSADCAEGWACITSSCCDAPTCQPPCPPAGDTAPAPFAARRGATNTGR